MSSPQAEVSPPARALRREILTPCLPAAHYNKDVRSGATERVKGEEGKRRKGTEEVFSFPFTRLPSSPFTLPLSLFFRLGLVLSELAVEGLAPDAEGAGGARLVAAGVVERGLDRPALDLFDGGGHGDFERESAALGGGARSLAARARALLAGGAADLF